LEGKIQSFIYGRHQSVALSHSLFLPHFSHIFSIVTIAKEEEGKNFFLDAREEKIQKSNKHTFLQNVSHKEENFCHQNIDTKCSVFMLQEIRKKVLF
jgi:hypothetical protein